jgi:hypothetical protein
LRTRFCPRIFGRSEIWTAQIPGMTSLHSAGRLRNSGPSSEVRHQRRLSPPKRQRDGGGEC